MKREIYIFTSVIIIFSIIIFLEFFLKEWIISDIVYLFKDEDSSVENSVFNPYANNLIIIMLILIIFFILTLFLLEKDELKIIYISSLFIIAWELILENIAWYLNWWDFASDEIKPIYTIGKSLYIGLGFYLNGILLSLIYLYSIKYLKNPYNELINLSIIIGWSLVGYFADILIFDFDTFILTLIVWFALNSFHYLIFRKLYKFYFKEKDWASFFYRNL